MIKINLIGEEKRKKKRKPFQLKNVTTLFIIIMVATVLINGGAFAYLYFTVSGLQDEKKKNDVTLAELNKKIGEVKRLEELNKEITNRKNIIQEITKNKPIPVRLMNEINQTLSDGLWITNIKYEKKEVNIEGIALTNISLVGFVDNLKNSKFAMNVYLQESNQVEFEKVPVYKFKLTFQVAV
ncbi:MAG: PilN domain-containing protein [Thermodesulfovibrionales bacterium]|nr:PilN domain-containing protein [Thermodesulfovibrionales bacterium]